MTSDAHYRTDVRADGAVYTATSARGASPIDGFDKLIQDFNRDIPRADE